MCISGVLYRPIIYDDIKYRYMGSHKELYTPLPVFTATVHGQWSGVFNLFKFDHTCKKEMKKENPCCLC